MLCCSLFIQLQVWSDIRAIFSIIKNSLINIIYLHTTHKNLNYKTCPFSGEKYIPLFSPRFSYHCTLLMIIVFRKGNYVLCSSLMCESRKFLEIGKMTSMVTTIWTHIWLWWIGWLKACVHILPHVLFFSRWVSTCFMICPHIKGHYTDHKWTC